MTLSRLLVFLAVIVFVIAALSALGVLSALNVTALICTGLALYAASSLV